MDMPSAGQRAQRLGLWAIGAALGLFALWGAMAPMHSAVVTLGQVKVESNRKLVQHAEGGVVKRVLVRDGQRVKQGQVLIELDGVKEESGYTLLRELFTFETARRQRLDAEQQLLDDFPRPETEAVFVDPELLARAYERELRIFKLRRHLLNEQRGSYERQLQALVHEQAALRRQVESSTQSVRLAQDELQLNTVLERDQFVSRTRLLALERGVTELGAKQSEHEALLAQSESRRNELGLRIASSRSEYQRQASEEYKESTARWVQLREQLRPAVELARRMSVVAPADGTVVGLRVNGAGEVAPPREPLMEIVPMEEQLVVEAHAPVDAIEQLRLQQATELRFTTFNARTTPMVEGIVTYVSADAATDRNGQPYYVLRVKPQEASLKAAGIRELKPGMAAEVYVLVEPRTVLHYLWSPITNSLRQAMRER